MVDSPESLLQKAIDAATVAETKAAERMVKSSATDQARAWAAASRAWSQAGLLALELRPPTIGLYGEGEPIVTGTSWDESMGSLPSELKQGSAVHPSDPDRSMLTHLDVAEKATQAIVSFMFEYVGGPDTNSDFHSIAIPRSTWDAATRKTVTVQDDGEGDVVIAWQDFV